MEDIIKKFLLVNNGYGYGYGNSNGYCNGNGNGDGYGDGNINGYGDGNINGYGDGNSYGNGYGDGNGNGIKRINGQVIHCIDSVPTTITSIKNNIAKGFILNNDLTLSKCYVVKQNDLFAHGETVRKAVEALQDKLFEDLSEEERIDMFIDKFGTDINKKFKAEQFYNWHNKLTGSCKMGRNDFVERHNIDLKADMSIKDFIDLTINAYGGKVIRELKERYD